MMKPSPATKQQLTFFFQRNGYLRLPNPVRQEQEGHQVYKKGYEVRLVAGSERELQQIRSLLHQAGFKAGKPFVKGQQWIQPIYGREGVERFCELCGSQLEA